MSALRGFRGLVDDEAWLRLPAAVRRRFGEPGRVDVFVGEVVSCRLTRFARAFDALSRRLGAPLPALDEPGAAVVVSVVDDGAGGQFWTRVFHARRGFPRVIQSHMRFDRERLEERLGIGLIMSIDLETDARGLHFVSAGYALAVGRWRLPVPAWFGPGAMRLDHAHVDERRFDVTITLTHPWWGEILRQTCAFEDHASNASRSR